MVSSCSHRRKLVLRTSINNNKTGTTGGAQNNIPYSTLQTLDTQWQLAMWGNVIVESNVEPSGMLATVPA